MAPERFTDPDRTDPRVDVYSLACVLYECLTGQRPFPASDKFALAHAHLEVPPPRVSDLRPELQAFDRIVARGMAKNPDERYRSAGDLATEVDSVASAPGGSIPVRPNPPPPSLMPPPALPPPALPPHALRGRGTPHDAVRPEPTRMGPTPLPRTGRSHEPTATRTDPPPTRLLPSGALPPGTVPPGTSPPGGSPPDPHRPRGRERVALLGAAGVVLVVLGVVLIQMLGGGTTGSGTSAQSTTSVAAPSSTAPTTAVSRSVATTSPTTGDLGIAGTPISVLPCDGRWITIVGSAYANDASTNRQQVADLLNEFPGSAYLLADTGCHSQLPGGAHARNYRVFLGPFDNETQACAARPTSVTDPWVKPLDNTTDPEMAHCVGNAVGE